MTHRAYVLYSLDQSEVPAMKYLYQFCVIMIFVFLGEVMGYVIPLPVAGSIYGLVLLFLALAFGIIKLAWVEDVANWLHSVMALFFIAPVVAIIDVWGDISHMWWMLVLVLIAAYMVTMITTGMTADAMIGPDKKTKNKKAAK